MAIGHNSAVLRKIVESQKRNMELDEFISLLVQVTIAKLDS